MPEASSTSSQQVATNLLSHCETIASSKKILPLISKRLEENGLVGESTNAQLLYLAATTRLLPKPVSAVVKGPSSAGKSFLLEKVMELFDPTAYKSVSGMSEKAIVRTAEDLQHQCLVIGELSGIDGDKGFRFLRQLMSEGRVNYMTVDPNADGFDGVTINVEGPVSVLMTTTEKRLFHEDETRFLSLYLDHSPAQQKQIFLAQARARNRASRPSSNNSDWHAFSRWLAEDIRDVDIPFAEGIAKGIDYTENRLKRDMNHVYSLIEASAIIHRQNRDVTEENLIVATIEDYENIYPLVNLVLSHSQSIELSPQDEEVLELVAMMHAHSSGGGAKQSEIEGRFQVDSTVISKRISRLCELGRLRKERSERDGRVNLLFPVEQDQKKSGILPEPSTIAI